MHREFGDAGKRRNGGDRVFHLGDEIAVSQNTLGAKREHFAHIKPRHDAADEPQHERVALDIAAAAQADGKCEPVNENRDKRLDDGPRPTECGRTVCAAQVGARKLKDLFSVINVIPNDGDDGFTHRRSGGFDFKR